MNTVKGEPATGTSGAPIASLIGRTLGGYEVLALIGRGAAGTVYLAEDKGLQRYLALKVLLGNLARNPSLVKSLRLEAKAAAPLRHPGIVRIYSAGIDQGTPYIAMEYVEGEPLDRFLKRQDRLHWTKAFYIGLQIAEALRYTHSRGVTHRDIKPANILLDSNGQARLTDFGIASIQAEEDLPEASGFLGTPHYMSPEQCEGKTAGPASDLYSLGVTLYQMIAGELPFTSDSPIALVKAIVNDVPPRLNKLMPDVPDDVARLVAHLLEKRPENRPKDAEAVCAAMSRLQTEGGGKSALPSALSAFIKEQAQIRTMPVVVRGTADRKAGGAASRRFRRVLSGPLAKGVGSVALAVACALPPVLAWNLSPAHGRAATAPLLTEAALEQPVEGVRVVRLRADGFRLDSLAWAGDERLIIGRAVGTADALTQGAAGLVSVDPRAGKAWSLRAPAGGAFQAGPPNVMPLETCAAAPARAPEGTPLSGAVLVQACVSDVEDGGHVSLLAQKWHEGTPRAAELYRAPLARDANPLRHAVPAPDGSTVCLVLREPHGNGTFLAERDTRWNPLDRVGPRLSPLDGSVIPESVQYSPDGALLAFIVERDAGERELWTVPSGASADRAVRLLADALTSEPAFSPDGRRLAVTRETGGACETWLVNLEDGSVEAGVGAGRVASQSWHPSGGYLLVTAPDPADSTLRAWAVEAAAPYRRVRLEVPGEITPGPWAVSADGTWAAATGDGTGLTAVLVRLGGIRFDG